MRPEGYDASKLDDLIKDLQTFIELSFQENPGPLKNWLDKAITQNGLKSRCHIINDCKETHCPAYKNASGRCWLIAGTMCNGKPQGKFAEKYGSCTRCKAFQDLINDGPVHKLQELTIILIHSLNIKHDELKDALSNLKTLKGLLPICTSCNKVRNDEGVWQSFDFFIDTHSEAQVSHGMCPDCAKKHFPEYYKRIIEKKNLNNKTR